MNRSWRIFGVAMELVFLLPPNGVMAGDLNPISAVDKIYSEMDPFFTQDEVPTSPAKSMKPEQFAQPCQFSNLGNPLSLVEAVERSLCYNAQTREAWANLKARSAEVGISKSAYLPNLNATPNGTFGNVKTKVRSLGFFSREGSTTTYGYSLNLSWVLFDFGLRSANLENAEFLLAAAKATQDATLQSVFVTAAQAYYDS